MKNRWFVFLILALLISVGLVLSIKLTPAKPIPKATNAVAKIQPQTLTAQNHTINLAAKILFIGDTMLARTIGEGILQGANPFAHVQSTFSNYDLRVANIETTIADPKIAKEVPGKLYTFNAPVAAIPTLKTAGIDVACLANNHTRDFGPEATADMISRLQNAGIKTCGAGLNIDQAFQPLIVAVAAKTKGEKVQTIKIAIIAVNSIENYVTNATITNPGSAFFDKDRISSAIKTARANSDIVVVFPHWGTEYQTTPSATQTSWGHFFIDIGADIVIGSHPHVVQTTENYQGKYIVYSLGNFVFDGMGGNALNGQMIGLEIHLKGASDGQGVFQTGTRNVTLETPTSIPIHIDDRGYPELN